MSKTRITERMAFIGGGQMAEALIAGLIATHCCEPGQIWATDPVVERCDTLKRLHGVRVGSSNREAAGWAGIIVLAVKPQILDGVMKDIAGELKRALTVSVAAGIPIQTITNAGGTGTRVVLYRGGAVAADRVCAVRTPWGVVLSRVRFKGRTVLLLPGKGHRAVDAVGVDDLKALRGMIAGTHVLFLRR